jgi:hypothetical protein
LIIADERFGSQAPIDSGVKQSAPLLEEFPQQFGRFRLANATQDIRPMVATLIG